MTQRQLTLLTLGALAGLATMRAAAAQPVPAPAHEGEPPHVPPPLLPDPAGGGDPPRGRRPRRRGWWGRRLVVLVAVLVAAGAAAAAWAYFSASVATGSSGEAQATSIDAGATPSVSLTAVGREVHVTWGASTLANGTAVDGYVVTRYPQGGGAGTIDPFSACAGTVTGLSCNEDDVPPGAWQYTITPVKGTNWRGPASSLSGVVTVAAAALSLNGSPFGSAAFTGSPATASTTGSITGFAGSEGVAYNLDSSSPPSGTALTGSPTSVGTNGDASITSVGIPESAGDGAHTVYALGNASYYPSQASAGIVLDTVAPSVSASLAPSANGTGWNDSPVQVSLTESDPSPSSGNGPIKYTTDGSDPTTSSTAVTYTAPFDVSAEGTTTIKFYATDAAGNASPVTTQQVEIDTVAPTNSFSLAAQTGGGSLLAGSTVYYQGVTAGSFALSNDLTDTASGPASTGYAALTGTTTGWSFTSSSVTSGPPYVSNAFSWSGGTSSSPSETATGFDAAGNQSAATLSFANDSTPPAGGTFAVNSETAGSTPSTGWNSTGTFSISALTDYTETQSATESGLASSTLTVQSAPLTSSNGISAGTCGSFGAASVISSRTLPIAQTKTTGCYLYTLTGTDNVGNAASVSAIVMVDTSGPSSPTTATPTPATGTSYQYVSGSTVWFNPAQAGSFTVDSSTSDGDSGISEVAFPSLTSLGLSGGGTVSSPYSGTTFRTTYSWPGTGSGSTAAAAETITATNGAGGSTGNTSAFSIGKDGTAPTTTDNAPSGWHTSSVTVTLTPTDNSGGSGVANTYYTTDGSTPTTSSSSGTSITLSSDGVYPIEYFSVDRVGNAEAVQTAANEVEIDKTPPSTTLSISPSSPNGTNGWYSVTAPTVTLTASDATSGVASTTYSINGGSSQTYTGPFTLPDGSDVVTYYSTDVAGNVETQHTSATYKVDTVAPSGVMSLGSATHAYFSGDILYFKPNAAGSFAFVDTVTDSGSGAASATFSGLSASGWSHSTETVSTPSGGPYQSSTYSWSSGAVVPANQTTTSTDNAGNTSGETFSFVADSTAPNGGALSVDGTAATPGGSTSSTTSTSFAINSRTDYGEALTATQSGLLSSVLTIQSETLSGNTCGAPGGPYKTAQTISGTTNPAITAGYCYVYTLTGTDRVGNTASIKTTVKVTVVTPFAASDLGNTAQSPTKISGGNTATGPSVTTTSGRPELILVHVTNSNQATGTTISSITGPFTGATQVTAYSYASKDYTFVWQATGDGTGPSAVTVNFDSGTTSGNAAVDVVELAAGNVVLGCGSCTNSGNSSSASATLSVQSATDTEIAFFGIQAGKTFSTPTGFSTLADGQGAGMGTASFGTDCGVNVQTPVDSTAAGSGNWGAIGIEIQATAPVCPATATDVVTVAANDTKAPYALASGNFTPANGAVYLVFVGHISSAGDSASFAVTGSLSVANSGNPITSVTNGIVYGWAWEVTGTGTSTSTITATFANANTTGTNSDVMQVIQLSNVGATPFVGSGTTTSSTTLNKSATANLSSPSSSDSEVAFLYLNGDMGGSDPGWATSGFSTLSGTFQHHGPADTGFGTLVGFGYPAVSAATTTAGAFAATDGDPYVGIAFELKPS